MLGNALRSLTFFVVSAVLLTASRLAAVETLVVHENLEECDPLFIPDIVDELGISPPFPLDERLSAIDVGDGPTVCESIDDTTNRNPIVEIVNLTAPPTSFRDVWYVADDQIFLTNPDGRVATGVNQDFGLAFKIDRVGVNRPLIEEIDSSGQVNTDGIWMPGETWRFVIQDYFDTTAPGAQRPPDAINSIGVVSAAAASTGSIIAVPLTIEIPEPSSLALGCLTLAVLMFRHPTDS